MCSVHCASLQNQINQMIMHTHTISVQSCSYLILHAFDESWCILRCVFGLIRSVFSFVIFFSFWFFFQHEMLNGWLNHVVLGVDSSNAVCPFLHRQSVVSSHTEWLYSKTLSNLTIGSLFHIRYCIIFDRSVRNENENYWWKRLQARIEKKIERSIRISWNYECDE